MGLTVYRTRCALLGAAVLVLSTSFFLAAYFVPQQINKAILNGVLGQVIVDSVNSTGYASWQDTRTAGTPPIYMKFYVFNLTNPDEYLAGAIPTLEELGPYSYLENRVHLNVTFEQNGTSVKYWLWEFFNFDSNTTAVDPDTGEARDPCSDIVYSPYIAYATVQNNLNSDWWQSLLFSALVSTQRASLLHPVRVQELIWGTYCNGTAVADPLLALVARLTKADLPVNIPLQANVTSPGEALATTGPSVQYTGKGNTSLIHDYSVWNGNSSVSCWATPEANLVQGSDAFNFPPGTTEQDILQVWVDSIFRSVHVAVNQTIAPGTASVEGIDCLWFTASIIDFFPNPAYYGLGPAGVLNLTSASQGAPLFVSKPHFLDADPYYLSLVSGLSPNRTLHDTNLLVEPISGITMQSQKRLQLNINVNVSLLYPSVSAAYIPLVWIEESGTITPSLAEQFKDQVYTAQHVGTWILWVGIIVGALLMLCTFAIVLAILAPDRNPAPEDESEEALLNPTRSATGIQDD